VPQAKAPCEATALSPVIPGVDNLRSPAKAVRGTLEMRFPKWQIGGVEPGILCARDAIHRSLNYVGVIQGFTLDV
jgi:hypothetical protein